MKVVNYRMSGLSWDVSKNESLLRPLTKGECKEISALFTECKTGTFGIYEGKAANGTEYKEVLVGRTGWAHRGSDYYSVSYGDRELRTRSYSTAIRMFGRYATL